MQNTMHTRPVHGVTLPALPYGEARDLYADALNSMRQQVPGTDAARLAATIAEHARQVWLLACQRAGLHA